MSIFVKVELVREKCSLGAELGATGFLVFKRAIADPDKIVVGALSRRALQRGQGISGKRSCKQVSVKVEQEVLERPAKK